MPNLGLSLWIAILPAGISVAPQAPQLTAITSVRLVGDQYFFLQSPKGSKHGTLMVRRLSEAGPRKLLDPSSLAPAGKTAEIIDLEPSWDGKQVAVGIVVDGEEDRAIRVVRVADGRVLEDSIPGTVDGDASWADDNRTFYYRAFQILPAGAPPAARLDNMRAYRHRVGDNPKLDTPVFGPDIAVELHLPKTGFVNAFPIPGTSLELAVQSGAPTELDSFWVRDTAGKAPGWRQIADHKDRVVFEFATHGTIFYYVTIAGAENGRVMAFDAAKEDISHAKPILPESDLKLSDRDQCGVAAAQDALYVYGLRNGSPVVARLPYGNPAAKEEIPLPTGGTLADVGAEDRVPGLIFTLTSPTQPAALYRYDPEKKKSLPVHVR